MKIEEGIHSLSMENYHAQTWAVSKSMLDRLAITPAHLQAYLKEPRKEPTPAMKIGTLTHLAVLEPDKFIEGTSHAVKPEGMKFSTKEGKAWQEEHEGLTIITTEDLANIRGMHKAIHQHDLCKAMLKKGAAERSVFSIHKPSGVMRRIRPDFLAEDQSSRPVIIDLKTTEDALDFSRTVANFGYETGNAFYVDTATDAGITAPFYIFLVIEKNPPYGIRIIQLDDDAITIGKARCERLLDLYAKCNASGLWPCYPEGIEVVSLPKYAKIKAQEEGLI